MGHPLVAQHERLVAGVMSGTSLDGVDVAIARIRGNGPSVRIAPLGFQSTPYPPPLRTLLWEAATRDVFSITMLSQLNVRVAHAYAHAIETTLQQIGIPSLNLVGSHGQTIRHVPQPAPCAELRVASTLQIGDPSTLAHLLNTPVVGDFRMADMAVGGQGAPLVPYFDYVTFSDPHETRVLLNVGGIANISVLPKGGDNTTVYGFDTGCGNMVLDALAEHLLGEPFDRDGQAAARGIPSDKVLETLLEDAYYEAPPPKSTGREHYGAAYVQRFLAACGTLSTADMLATATALTARSIWLGYETFVRPRHPADVLIVSGGGRHNRMLMQMLKDVFAPVPVRPSDDYDVDADAKEALCFALLAHETMNGYPSNIPGATGARCPAVLGKICLPS